MTGTNTECRKVRELLLPYVEGELDIRNAGVVDLHISSCPECRLELESLRAVVSPLSSPLPDPGENFWRSFPSLVSSRIASEERKPRWQRVFQGFFLPDMKRPVYAGSAAFAMVLAVLLFVIVPRFRNSGDEDHILLSQSKENPMIRAYSLSDSDLAELSRTLSSEFESASGAEENEDILYTLGNSQSDVTLALSSLDGDELSRLEEELRASLKPKERSQL